MSEVLSSAALKDALQAFVRMYEPHEAREDTELFPEFRKIVSSNEYDALGEDVEKKEHELFGEDGFDRNVAEVAKLEQALGIYDLRSRVSRSCGSYEPHPRTELYGTGHPHRTSASGPVFTTANLYRLCSGRIQWGPGWHRRHLPARVLFRRGQWSVGPSNPAVTRGCFYSGRSQRRLAGTHGGRQLPTRARGTGRHPSSPAGCPQRRRTSPFPPELGLARAGRCYGGIALAGIRVTARQWNHASPF